MSQIATPTLNANSVPALAGAVQAGRVTWGWTIALLLSRTLLFLTWQAAIALLLAIGGSAAPFAAAAAWWPICAALTGIVSLLLLIWRFRREQIPLVAVFGFTRVTVWQDLLTAVGIFVIAAPLTVIPNLLLAQALFGDPEGPVPLFFRQLPLWAAIISLIAFPLSVGLTELPTYFGYAMPRMEALTGRGWLAVLLAGAALSAQHTTLPLVLDWRFVVWRLFMFLPLALWLAVALRWRPRLLPYLMIGHGLLDLSAAWIVFSAAL